MATKYRRGFITECEKNALKYRQCLSLSEHSPLNPRQLASFLGIKVLTPEDIPGLDASVLNHLLITDSSSWSAVTLTLNKRSAVILNSSHSLARKNNDLSHELAHIILNHEPTQLVQIPGGKMMISHYRREYEDEADYLGAALLVPRNSLLHYLKIGHDDTKLASFFGVSNSLLTMRKHVTGIAKQLKSRYG